MATLFASAIAAETNGLPQQFEATLDTFRQEYGLPGATAAYVLPDGEVGVAAVGLADVRTNTAMTPRSRMLAASIGKTFVGAAVVALAREGRLGLDDSISDCRRKGSRRKGAGLASQHSQLAPLALQVIFDSLGIFARGVAKELTFMLVSQNFTAPR